MELSVMRKWGGQAPRFEESEVARVPCAPADSDTCGIL